MASNELSRGTGGNARPVRRWALAGLGALVVVVLAPIAWYLLSPLFIDRRVQEDPAVAGSAAAGTVIARGTFGEVDAIHKGEGQAILTRLPDGRYSLRFEGFRVTNGPDLYVYLSGHPAPRSSAQLHEIADLEVATLKGNVGDQAYELPAGFDPARFKSAVVYCKRFTTVFSTAELRPS
jgi:Electron transfer DM13